MSWPAVLGANLAAAIAVAHGRRSAARELHELYDYDLSDLPVPGYPGASPRCCALWYRIREAHGRGAIRGLRIINGDLP